MNLLNRLGGIVHFLGIKPFALNADKILEQARSASGFDFVDPSMREGLDALIDDVSANGNPNAFGQIAIQKLLQRNATARFQIEKALHESPAIEAEPIEQPLFIIGMPRSGTTVLHLSLIHI